MIAPIQRDETLLSDIRSAQGSMLHVWWLGQSGFLFKHEDSFLLIDPYLSDSLTLKYAATDKPHVRMTEQCIAPGALSFVNLVCSSHQHTDHFDETTLHSLGSISLVLPAAVEKQARQRLGDAPVEYLGIDDGLRIERDGWCITGVAAAHNEIERDELNRCKFLGFLVRRGPFTFYHSGDTLLHPGLQQALKPAECDLMMLPINGNRPERRVAGNMDGPEAASLAHASQARLVVPHHFEMFEFNTASPDDFVQACNHLGQPHQVMRCGERISLPPR